MKHLLLSLAGILTLALALCLPAQGQSAEDLLQQGSRLEQVEGDYEGAIALYRQIAEDKSADRRLVARALLQMGKAYEILGRDGAREAYSRIVSEYGDFASVAGEAAERIAAFRRLDAVPVVAHLPGSVESIMLDSEGDGGLWGAGMSPDGKYVVRSGGRGFVVQDIESGAVDSLSVVRELCSGYFTARFSPTGNQIALGCWLGETGNIGVAIYDREVRTVELIFDGGDYFAATQDDGLELRINDWSNDGSAVLAAFEIYNSQDSTRHAEHTLLVPIAGGTPAVIETDFHETEFWEDHACLLQDGRFKFGTYGWERSSIHRIDTGTGESVRLLSDDLANIELYDCLPASNTLIYSRELFETSEALLAAVVDPDGAVGAPRFLGNLPKGSYPVPGAKNGSVHYSTSNQKSYLAVADVDTLRGRALSGLRQVEQGNFGGPPRWSPDGNYFVATRGPRARIEGPNSKEPTWWKSSRQLGLMIWSPDGSQLISSWPDSSYWHDRGTGVYDRDTGEIRHEVADLAAVAWLPDATGFYYVTQDDNGRCLGTYRFESRATKEVFCLDPELAPSNLSRWAISPGWALSPDGSTFVYWGAQESQEGQGRPIFLLDTVSWKMEQVEGLLRGTMPQISWSGDSRRLFNYGNAERSMRAYGLAKGEWADWSFPELADMEFASVSVNPSGTRVAVLFVNYGPAEIQLSILHQPPGLREAK